MKETYEQQIERITFEQIKTNSKNYNYSIKKVLSFFE